MKLAVCELFYSLQGEGRTVGVPAVFLRLAGCNMMCGGKGTERDGLLHDGATWRCDTIEVWMKGFSLTFEELTTKLIETDNALEKLKQGAHLVITGGEPLMQQQQLLQFLEHLEQTHGLTPIIEIETNASVMPLASLDARVSYWNTSPKLINSGVSTNLRIRPECLAWFNNSDKTIFKFVVSALSDWEEIVLDFISTGYIAKNKIMLMPAASDRTTLLNLMPVVAQCCIQNNLRMGTRLHIEIWNQKTGV